MLKIALTIVFTLGLSQISFAGGGGHGFPQPEMDKSKATKPGLVKLSAPAPLAKVAGQQVSLSWETSENADSYHVQIATDPNFKWLLKNEYFHKGLIFELSGLEAGTRYFWRVAGVKGDNDAGWTQGTFTMSSFETSK